MQESDRAHLVGYCTRLGLALSPLDIERIDGYLDLLGAWNRRLRLTGERDPTILLRKHVADALACVPLMPMGGAFIDLGTGGGLPGAVVACVRPDLETTLIDSRERPITFLCEVIRRVPLERTRAIAMRAEDAARDPTIARHADVVTVRALRMSKAFELARPLLAPRGRVVSMQTPSTSADEASAIAQRHGLHLVDVRDYRLPDGDPRRLIVAAEFAVSRSEGVC